MIWLKVMMLKKNIKKKAGKTLKERRLEKKEKKRQEK